MIARWQVTADDAWAAVTAARERAAELGLAVAIAVVDAGGGLVAVHRDDSVQPAGPDVAIAKARAAALFRRPTSAFAEADSPAVLLLPTAVPHALGVAGGVPMRGPDGGVAGAVGVSGGNGEQDAAVARAAAAACA